MAMPGYRFGGAGGGVYGGLGRGLVQGAKNFVEGQKQRAKLAAAAAKAEGQSQGALIIFKQAHDNKVINDEQYAKLLNMTPEQQAAAIGSVHMATAAAAEQENRESIRSIATQNFNAAWQKREDARQSALAGPNANVQWANGAPYRLDPETGQWKYASELAGPTPPAPGTTVQLPGPNGPVNLPVTSELAKVAIDAAHPEIGIRQQTGLSPQQILDPIVYDKDQGKYTSATQRGDMVADKSHPKPGVFTPSDDPNKGDMVNIDGTLMPYSQYASHQRKLADAGFFPAPSSNLPPEEQQLQAILQNNLQRSIQGGTVSGTGTQGIISAAQQGSAPPMPANAVPPPDTGQQGVAPQAAPQNAPPPEAIAYLQQNPNTAAAFDQKAQQMGWQVTSDQILNPQAQAQPGQ